MFIHLRIPVILRQSAFFLFTLGSALLYLSIPVATISAQTIGWSGAAEASGNILFGAAHDRVTAFKVNASKTDSALEVHADAWFTYADTKTDSNSRRFITARASRLSLSADYRPFEHWSPFVFGTRESSLQQRVDNRYSGGIGAKYTLYRHGDDELSLSAAVLGERTRLLQPDSGVDPVDTRARWSARLKYDRQLSKAVHLSHVTFYQPTVGNLPQYTMNTTTTLAVQLRQWLALTVTLNDLYDSEARMRGAVSNHDGHVLFGVQAKY
jgi:hypothetical protein